MPVVVAKDRQYINAPEDAYVAYIKESSDVKIGEKVIVLESLKLENAIRKCDAVLSVIDLSLEPYTDGRIDQLLEGVKEEADSASQHLQRMNEIYKLVVDQRASGSAGSIQVAEALDKVQIATIAYSNMKRRAFSEPLRVSNTRKQLLVGKDMVTDIRENLERIRKTLSINAALTGYFVPIVVSGSFVKQGDALGEMKDA